MRNIRVISKKSKVSCERMKEKIKNIHQDFSRALVKGTHSGSGKIVHAHWDELLSIWGGSPSTQALPFGIQSSSVSELSRKLTGPNSLESVSCPGDSHSCTPSDYPYESGRNTPVEQNNSCKQKNMSDCPILIDNKRKNLEKKKAVRSTKRPGFVKCSQGRYISKTEYVECL